MKVRKTQRDLQDTLNEHAARSPRFKDLSERVEEILREWNQDVSTGDLMEDIEKVTREFNEETKPGDVSEREWLEQVVTDVLAEEVPVDVEVDDQMIQSIVDDFMDEWERTKNMSDTNH